MKEIRTRYATFSRLLVGLLASSIAAVACGDDASDVDSGASGKGATAGSSSGKAGSGSGKAGSGSGKAGSAAQAGAGGTASGEAGAPAEGGGAGEPAVVGGSGGEGGDSGEAAPEARLVIADQEASKLYVYSVPELEQLVVLDDITFADHAGFVPLNDGRVLFADGGTQELVAVQVLGTQVPRVVGRAGLSTPAIHLAVDPQQEYAAVSGAAALADGVDAFTLVRLSDFFHKPALIPTGEPGIMLGGSPLFLYHRNDDPAQVEAYAFSDLWSGTVSLKGSKPIADAPHGEAMAHAAGKIFVAADDGINALGVNGASLGTVKAIPYDVDGRTGGRAYYARLSYDGNFLYTYLRDSGPDFAWAWKDWVSDAFIVDVKAETAKRLEIGKGLVYRLADSAKFAIFVQYHPDGDFAHFLDTDAKSATFQKFVGKVPLETMSKAPTGADADPWSSEAFRLAGMVPSGRWAFVTHGGDGKVSMIDTRTMKVEKQLTLPTPLNYGGYLLGVEAGATLHDTIGR